MPSRQAGKSGSWVSSEKMNDDAIFLLSKDIAKKVEAELSYPDRSKWW